MTQKDEGQLGSGLDFQCPPSLLVYPWQLRMVMAQHSATGGSSSCRLALCLVSSSLVLHRRDGDEILFKKFDRLHRLSIIV